MASVIETVTPPMREGERSRAREVAVHMRPAAMLWTGGKDSSLAMCEASRSGCDVRCLATFAPPEPHFLAHPLTVMTLQAEALALPHHVLPVTEPFEKAYETALRRLRDDTGVNTVVTGDIAEVDGRPNWIRERTRVIGMDAVTPLWKHDRRRLLERLLEEGFEVLISCVDTRRLDRSWAGRRLDARAIAELQIVRDDNGLDLSGENGEYHTLVVDGPAFERRIDVRAYTVRDAGSLAYLDIHAMSLKRKDAGAELYD